MLRWLTECDEGWPEGMGPLGALSECKIRVDDAAEAGFDWLQDNFSALFDAMAGVLEVLIDVILALLQQPPNTGWFQDLRRSEITYLYPEALHPILITLLMCALAWWVHRGWKMPVLLGAGLLFIINQGYWEDDGRESLTLVRSGCGRPAVAGGRGRSGHRPAAHRPWLYAGIAAPVLDLMQTLATF